MGGTASEVRWKRFTHEQMLQWYQTHLSHFETPCRARWEELMVRIAKYPSKADAYAAIAERGTKWRWRDAAGPGRPGGVRRSTASLAASATGPAREASRPNRSTRRCSAFRSGNSSRFGERDRLLHRPRIGAAGNGAEALRRTYRTKSKRKSPRKKSRRSIRSISPSSAAKHRFSTIFDDSDAAAERVSEHAEASRY